MRGLERELLAGKLARVESRLLDLWPEGVGLLPGVTDTQMDALWQGMAVEEHGQLRVFLAGRPGQVGSDVPWEGVARFELNEELRAFFAWRIGRTEDVNLGGSGDVRVR